LGFWAAILGSVALLAAVPASAQPAAVALLSPVEAAAWEASSASPVEGDRVCLEPGAYVAGVRVEPGFEGAFNMLRRSGDPVAPRVIRQNDGLRETWAVFQVFGDGERCFSVTALVWEGASTEGHRRAVALRAQIYSLRVGIDWD